MMKKNVSYVFWDVLNERLIVATKYNNISRFVNFKYLYFCEIGDDWCAGWSFESSDEDLNDRKGFIKMGKL